MQQLTCSGGARAAHPQCEPKTATAGNATLLVGQVVGGMHVVEEFGVGVTAVMLAAQQDIRQGNLKHKDLTGQEVSSQVCLLPPFPSGKCSPNKESK